MDDLDPVTATDPAPEGNPFAGVDPADLEDPDQLRAYKPTYADSARVNWQENADGLKQSVREFLGSRLLGQEVAQRGDSPFAGKVSQASQDQALADRARRRKMKDDSFESDGVVGKLIGAAAGLGAGLVQPENLIGLSAISRSIQASRAAASFGSELVWSMIGHGAEAAVVNTAIDGVMQAADIGSGLEDHWSYERTGLSALLGAGLGGAMKGGHVAVTSWLDARRLRNQQNDAIKKFTDTLAPGETLDPNAQAADLAAKIIAPEQGSPYLVDPIRPNMYPSTPDPTFAKSMDEQIPGSNLRPIGAEGIGETLPQGRLAPEGQLGTPRVEGQGAPGEITGSLTEATPQERAALDQPQASTPPTPEILADSETSNISRVTDTSGFYHKTTTTSVQQVSQGGMSSGGFASANEGRSGQWSVRRTVDRVDPETGYQAPTQAEILTVDGWKPEDEARALQFEPAYFGSKEEAGRAARGEPATAPANDVNDRIRSVVDEIGGEGTADMLGIPKSEPAVPPAALSPQEIPLRAPGEPMGAAGLVARGEADASKVKKQWRAETPHLDLEKFLADSKESQKALGDAGREIAADLTGVEFKDPGVKAPTNAEVDALEPGSEARGKAEIKLGRMVRKIEDPVSGERIAAPGTVTDQVRAGFVLKTPEQADAIVARLAQRFELIDEGWFVNSAGYFDRKVYGRFPDGTIGEIQLWEPMLLDAKEKQGGHDLYTEFDKAKRAGDVEKADALEREMRALYEKAIDALPPEWRNSQALGPALDLWKADFGRGGNAPNLERKSAIESTRPSIIQDPSLSSTQAPDLNTQASERHMTSGSPSSDPYFTSSEVIVPSLRPEDIRTNDIIQEPGTNVAADGKRPAMPSQEQVTIAARAVADGMTPALSEAIDARAGQYIGQVVPEIKPHDAMDASGMKVHVVPVLVELRDLITSAHAGYDQNLQPRDRSNRAASDEQIRKIVTQFDPTLLGSSPEADRGAPIVGPSRMVESGNGRVMALQKIYDDHPDKAAAYISWLEGQGIKTAGFEQPVLVRENVTPLTDSQRRDFTLNANKPIALALSPIELANTDARRLTMPVLDLLRDATDLGSAGNRDFIKAFLGGLDQAERAGLQSADGGVNPTGLARAKNAILARAYGDSPILSKIVDSIDDDTKSITNALMAAAPEWARMREDIANGLVRPEFDLTSKLTEAIQKVQELRERGIKLADHLDQLDMYAPNLDPGVQAFMESFYRPDKRRAAGAAEIAKGLNAYTSEARKMTVGGFDSARRRSIRKICNN